MLLIQIARFLISILRILIISAFPHTDSKKILIKYSLKKTIAIKKNSIICMKR